MCIYALRAWDAYIHVHAYIYTRIHISQIQIPIHIHIHTHIVSRGTVCGGLNLVIARGGTTMWSVKIIINIMCIIIIIISIIIIIIIIIISSSRNSRISIIIVGLLVVVCFFRGDWVGTMALHVIIRCWCNALHHAVLCCITAAYRVLFHRIAPHIIDCCVWQFMMLRRIISYYDVPYRVVFVVVLNHQCLLVCNAIQYRITWEVSGILWN